MRDIKGMNSDGMGGGQDRSSAYALWLSGVLGVLVRILTVGVGTALDSFAYLWDPFY